MSQESSASGGRSQETRAENFLQPLEPKTLAEKLYLVRFKTDTERHLKVDPEKCKPCKDKSCIYICPSDVYKLAVNEADRSGETPNPPLPPFNKGGMGGFSNEVNIVISFEACLECGTCRIACEFIDWRNPKGGFGVCFRFG